MGSLKCGISQKTADRRAKRTKIWDSKYTTVHICRVLLMPDSLSLVWCHSVHFAKVPIPRFSKHNIRFQPYFLHLSLSINRLAPSDRPGVTVCFILP